jgi:hypothetical protein
MLASCTLNECPFNGVLAGSVIVSTPQDVALSDVRKGIAMLKKVSVPVRLPHTHHQRMNDAHQYHTDI